MTSARVPGLVLSDEEREALNEALCDDLNDAMQHDGPGPAWYAAWVTHGSPEHHTLATVERIVAERVAPYVEAVGRVEALAEEDTHDLRSGVPGMVRLNDLREALRGVGGGREGAT